jgi:hypothetical protein
MEQQPIMSESFIQIPLVETTIQGVLFSKSIRSYYFILHVACQENKSNEDNHVIVRIQVANDAIASDLRSWCRTSFKLGDWIQIRGFWNNESNREIEWNHSRVTVDLASVEEANERIHVKEIHKWNMQNCQRWQQKYCPSSQNKCNPQISGEKRKISQETHVSDKATSTYRHGGGMGKRIQAKLVANFLLNMIAYKLNEKKCSNPNNFSGWVKPIENIPTLLQAMNWLNAGSGVIDAAGGSGHVSMALGLVGVISTVVDPRESVGKLPGRDRKIWNRALRTNIIQTTCEGGVPLCQPFHTFRAWFASKPDGINESFRNADAASDVPVCDETHDLLTRCGAIVALHPDEATDDIVDTAVKQKKPFVVIPCCVFARLFPNRRNPNNKDSTVSTYEDLLVFLAAKHKDIKRTELPFEGANIALWATF